MTDDAIEIDDVEAALANHHETLTEIARAIGLDETAIPEDPESKAKRAAFFGDPASSEAYQKEAEATHELTRHLEESLELADRIAERIGSEGSKRTSARSESADATAFRKALRGGQ